MSAEPPSAGTVTRRWVPSDQPGELGVEVVSAADFDEQINCGMKLVEENERLRAELADWQRMRNEAMAVATSNREEISIMREWRDVDKARIAELQASLAEARARLAELAAQKPATLRQRIDELTRQDEVHWKTRRTLLATIERLRAAAITACSHMGCYCEEDPPDRSCVMCKLGAALAPPAAPPGRAATGRDEVVTPEQRKAALAAFTEYFVKNYPGPNTVIYDPEWHAPRIFGAAQFAIENSHSAAAPAAPPQAEVKDG